MTDYTDIMVDIETTGTQPEHAAIIQISAVKFNLAEATVCGEMFDRCLALPPDRFWDEATRDWWLKQKRSVLQTILANSEDPYTILQEFCHWCYPPSTYRFWSKPTHFDFNFISSYCHDYGMPNPFHFRYATDLNSFLRGIYAPHAVPELDIAFNGDKHNALHDTLYQIKTLFAHMENADKWHS